MKIQLHALLKKQFCLMGCIFLLQAKTQAQSLEIHHLDVGQGDATFIVAKDSNGVVANTVLIDGGLKRYGQPIINYVRDTLHIDTIDYVIASHYDHDHVAGLAVVLDYALSLGATLKVDSVLDRGLVLYPDPNKGKTYKAQAARYGARRRTLTPGDTIMLFNDLTGGTKTGMYSIYMFCLCVNGSVYASPPPFYNAVATLSFPDENDLSTGFIIKYGKFKYLTCGDIGGKRGNQAATCDGSYGCNFANLETNVIAQSGPVSSYKINHHGSRCSSNGNWISNAQSPVAVISSGKNGRYKHPRAEVVAELNAADSLVNFYMTASVNYYGRILLPKGILNPVAGKPVDLIVRRTTYGINITTRSVFTVAGKRFDKY
jgi:competence protein ComEC